MHILRIFTMFNLSLLSLLITSSISVSVISILLFFLGRQTVSYLQNKKLKKDILIIYDVSYIAFFIYALICYSFMTENHYDYLQSFDGINVYIPYTQELLSTNTFMELIHKIYTTSAYTFVGSILIPFVYVGKLSSLMDGELYINIQLVIIVFASWTTVVVYNILIINNIPNKKALFYTLIYSLLSIHFYFSTFIVRDMPIALFFTILIYLSFKPYSLKNIFIGVFMIFLIGSMRLASGIFAFLYIFLMIILSLKKEGKYNKIILFLFFIFFSIITFLNMELIVSTIELKLSQYNSKQISAQGGTSTVAFLNILPPGISHIVKAFYNQLMPIPSWRTMVETTFRPEAYNIMNFPIVSATYFRYYMWLVIFIGIFNKKIRTFIISNKALMYNLFIAILFIALQSNAMGHRRLLGVYPVFFLLAIIVYQKLSNRDKKIIFLSISVIFILLQTVII